MNRWTACWLTTLFLAAPAPADSLDDESSLTITATAYTSIETQTNGEPSLGAWGDLLRPEMRVIAVSRDLLEMGLARGVEVKIEGLPGTWTVMDKMDQRWTKRIDIHMGDDMQRAKSWGIRQVRIHW